MAGRSGKYRGLGGVNTLKFSCQLVNDVADSFEEGSEFFVWISDDGSNKVPGFPRIAAEGGKCPGPSGRIRGD